MVQIKIWGSIDDGEPVLIAVADVGGEVADPDTMFAAVIHAAADAYAKTTSEVDALEAMYERS